MGMWQASSPLSAAGEEKPVIINGGMTRSRRQEARLEKMTYSSGKDDGIRWGVAEGVPLSFACCRC